MWVHNDTCGCANCFPINYPHRVNPHGGGGDWSGRGWDRSSYDSTPTSLPAPSGPAIGTTTKWGGGEDCCWLTTCPRCGAQVFFVRHNGGSVWFDSLGPPWPKHQCFADDPTASRLRSRLAERQISRRVLFVGVVIETVITRPGSGGRVVIEYGDRQRFESEVIASADLTELPGCLVLVTVDDAGHPRLHWGPELLRRAKALNRHSPGGAGSG